MFNDIYKNVRKKPKPIKKGFHDKKVAGEGEIFVELFRL